MLSALLYLRLTSLRNWVRQRVLRLKQPKYLAGAIVGAAYLWFFFLGPAASGGGARRKAAAQAAGGVWPQAGGALPGHVTGVALAIGALVLLVVVVLAWVLSQERASLGFSEAEIAFLFPAPVTRQALVHFRLVDAQLRSLIGALFLTLVSSRWAFASGSPVIRALGWWLILTAFNLHLAGVRFTLTRLADAGLGTWRRRTLVLGLLAAVLAATWAWLPETQRAPVFDGTREGGRVLAEWATALLGTAPLGWVVQPAKWLLGPFFAADLRAFLVALGPALLVLGVHYVWVVRSVVSFEEGSIERAEKHAARVAAVRSGRGAFHDPAAKGRPGPFLLPGTGRPELAFLWKNLLSTWSWLNVRVWAGGAVVIVAAGWWARSHPAWQQGLAALAAMPLVLIGYVIVAGPQFARQDIRQDLPNADILKTYPLAGWQIVLGEMLTPVTILTGVIWLLLLAAAVTFDPAAIKLPSLGRELFAPGTRAVLLAAAALLTPPLVALQLLVPNAAALVFPTWFQATRQRGGGGVDILGQRLIFFGAQLLTMLLVLLPAALAVAGAVFVVRLAGGPLALGVWLGAGGALTILLGELWAGLLFLGRRFEQFDLSSELRP
ncbi:MAG: hypothetical protein HZA93_18235 [Verrucomicrobia bacterium]|nr:hypothetical protein [Verrucomicrobiota bacterium]